MAIGTYPGTKKVREAMGDYAGGKVERHRTGTAKVARGRSSDTMSRGESPETTPREDLLLVRAIKSSYASWETFRELNRELVKDYGGTHYSAGSSGTGRKNRYLNLLGQALESYQMLLAYNRPRVMVSTMLPELHAFAKHFQYALNSMIKEIRLEETIQQWVLDAFFTMGIVKTHLADSHMVELEPDVWMDPGTPFASNVSLDDFVCDTGAKKLSEAKFMGDMYRIPYVDAIEMFGEEKMANYTPTSKYHVEGERLEDISRGIVVDDDEIEPMIDMADIWHRREGVIKTYVVHSRSEFVITGAPVAVEEWTGDEEGPYQILGFIPVPENIMPGSMASQLELLDSLVNNLMRKSARQANRQKDVYTYTPAGAETARRGQRSDDGEFIQVTAQDDVGVMQIGGVNQGNFAFMGSSIDLFDRMAGNLQARLGLGAQTDTVGQEKLIHGAADNKTNYMRGQVLKAVTRLVKSLGLMLWEDAFKTIVTEIPVQGAEGYSIVSEWRPGDREGKFLDYNFEVDVYSMQHQSPASKVQTINGLIAQVYMPMAQVLMEQGGMIDMFELTRTYAELLNLPELERVVKFQGAMDDEDLRRPALTSVPKAPVTTRNYVRSDAPNPESPVIQAASQMGPQQPPMNPMMQGM